MQANGLQGDFNLEDRRSGSYQNKIGSAENGLVEPNDPYDETNFREVI